MHEALDAQCPGHVADHVRSVAVGADKGVRRHDRTVHVALGGEVDHHVVALHGGPHRVAVTDVALHEPVAGIFGHVPQVVEVSRVGEGVEDRDRVVAACQDVVNVVGADEPGPAGHEQLHGRRP